MRTTTRLGALTAVIAAATLMTGCQEDQTIVDGAPTASTAPTSAGSSSAVGPDGSDAGRQEHLSEKGGYVVQGSKITFVFSNGLRQSYDVGQPIGDRTTVKSGTGTLTLKNGSASWIDLPGRTTIRVDQLGSGTVADKNGVVVVAPDGGTTCANGQGLQFVGADGSRAAASQGGAFFVDDSGKRTTYGQPSAGGKLAGRFTVCDAAKTVSVDLYSDVLFEFDKATLTPAGKTAIASAAKTIRADVSGKQVKVVGHTDSTGPQSANQTLGQQRADAVAAELRTQVPGIQLQTSSAGETQPVATNATDTGRSKNRRVTISYAR